MNTLHKLLVVLGLMLSSSGVFAQISVVEPGFGIINTFGLPANLSSELGTMLFSDDGNTVYILDESEDSYSAIWSASVTRDGLGNVTGFGTFSELFAYEYMDTGLEFGPGTGTYFFRVENDGIGQRLTNGTVEVTAVTPYDAQYGGLGFIPAGYTNGGDIVTVSYDDGKLYRHSVSADGDGSFTVTGLGTLYADFSASIGTSVLSDIIFITSGPLAGNAMLGLYDQDEGDSLVYFPLDEDGLPADGVTPAFKVYATGYNPTWGVAIDPVTDNIWAINYGEPENVALTQTGDAGVAVDAAVPVLSRYGLLILVLLILGISVVRARRSA